MSNASTQNICPSTVLIKPDMLYAEHMLRRLSDLGREDVVLKALGNMPTTLLELYKLLLDECGRDRSADQFHTLKTLFAWLAFSERVLFLSDGWDIVKSALSDTESTLDLESEIIGRSSRYVIMPKYMN